MQAWYGGKGGHGEGEGVGGEYKVGGMGTAMHVGRPRGRKQLENEKKNWSEKKQGSGEHIQYLTGVDVGGCEHGHEGTTRRGV